jgi:hypothetical protein
MNIQKKRYMAPTLKTLGIMTAVMISILLFGVLAVGCKQTEQVQPMPSVSIGTLIDSEKISEMDKKPYPVQYRIDTINRDQTIVGAAIAEYNLSGTGNLIGQLKSDKMEFCMVEYSVSYPKDFPQQRYGITDVTIPFEITSVTGGAIQVEDTIYQNLATTWEIGVQPQGYDFHAGDTYQGRFIFIMVKGYNEYLIHEIKADNIETEQVYIKGE